MSFFKKVASAVDKVVDKTEDGLHHARETAIGYINPNRRHDDPEEKMQDEVRAEINKSHRFESFANQRSDNIIKWHIDGHDYMYALSEMLDSAKEAIFILASTQLFDWWLTPELYLRRPPAAHPEWRLDRVLQRKAEEGVKVYVIVYKEVTQTMSMSSAHTKHALEALHPNIACMRHPDHIGSKDDVEYWSHHEKLVVIDNHRACVGGLDLCFGRWDTHNHPLADAHPLDFSKTLFPGQDYNNARIVDFQDVSNYLNNTISVLESARMPWHDVHMTLFGDVVLDLVQHFTERWNEVKKRKYRHDERYDWLALPHKIEVAPNEAVVRHPHREKWHQMGRQWKQHFHLFEGEEVDDDCPPPKGTCRVQAVRSVSDWSHGVLTEHSVQNAYCQLIREANHYIYIENQFFISSTQDTGPIKNQIAKALTERIIRAAQDGIKFKVVVVIPEVPGFAGDVKNESSVQIIMAGQYRTINRGGNSIYEEIRKAGFEPMDYIRFYHLRAFDRIHGPYESLIKKMTDNSGVSFHEAMVALSRQWIGEQMDEGQKAPTEVTVVLPQPTLQGVVVTGKQTEVKKETVRIPQSAEEAKQIIERFEHGAADLQEEREVADNVVQHMLEDSTNLDQEKWLGTEEEELQAYVSELLYIHSKVMIVDDRRVIMGSANINDRSQKGDGDSEIALVVEDDDMFETTMDGRPYMAARFAASLRRKLYKEHLGLIKPQWCDRNEEVTSFMQPAPIPNENEIGTPEDNAVADPLSEETDRLWNETAKTNREIFTEIFRPVPTNLIRDWNAYANYVPKVKTGHVAPGIPLQRVKERLSQVRGALVEMPLDFLIDQKDFTENATWSTFNPTLPVYI
ncbi:phospholipase D/nuclease [Punctularia strigosozonata HHB-11173 SS5]|uniref:phospholipase D/nuclease n=1 Tax=Punctularia strigosozonata (strain HHB-11173) TaxID=741275 RepID=UPI0004417494|nr:phospholipase D/nuclease [Punctularia strigosozonata HHB-11173 SS5]EIN06494.1 phospholipase D/nuclease [Punctularia strigosozonata HHB-11173 SS5]